MLEDVYAYVDSWHETTTDLPLNQFLGMTQEEYECWSEEPQCLRLIVQSHAIGRKFNPHKALGLAARSSNPGEAQTIEKWLIRTGRISSQS